MSDTRHIASTGATEPPDVVTPAPREPGWVGVVVFGGGLVLVAGAFQAMGGLVALFNASNFVVTRQGLVVQVDYQAWGWVHLILGLVAVVAGFGVLGGRFWGRVTGITLAVLSILVNFTFMAANPVWALIVIAADVLVIYALAAHGREIRD